MFSDRPVTCGGSTLKLLSVYELLCCNLQQCITSTSKTSLSENAEQLTICFVLCNVRWVLASGNDHCLPENRSHPKFEWKEGADAPWFLAAYGWKSERTAPQPRPTTTTTLIFTVLPLGQPMCRDQPNSREKMRDFMVEFLKCAKFHGKFTEWVWEIHGKFTGRTAVISRCYVNAI